MNTKIEVRKHIDKIVRDINGNVVREEYYYTLAVRKFFLWHHLYFYTDAGTVYFNGENEMVIRNKAEKCLHSEEVSLGTNLHNRYATHFQEEEEAIQVKHDMLQRPEKYVFIS